jgi:hypothetical protein
MKPNFDLKNPIVKLAIRVHQAQMLKALSIHQRVENAVLPIYWPLKKITRPEQIGSGVVVFIKGEYFIFSASHVFDDIGSFALLVGTGGGEPLATLSGERFSTKKGISGSHSDDPIDASVFHIQQGITEQIKQVALSIEDLDIEQSDDSSSVYIASGFRVKKSNTVGDQANAHRDGFSSIEYGQSEYTIMGIDKNIHLALAYDDQVLVNGRWQKSPSPKGMSGGAIVKVHGINIKPPFQTAAEPKQLLSAITIEQRREKARKPGVLLGTRIKIHINLINKYLPHIIDSQLNT